MRNDNKLQVFYKDRLVGTLALTVECKAAFAYADSWLKDGFSISPFSLPLKKQVFLPTKNYFEGLFGVFADSLPDAWGNVLLNRILKKNGIDPGQLNVLDRLAIVGNAGMGALTYRPEISLVSEHSMQNLDQLAQDCKKILQTEYTENLDILYQLGGTSGGARPKIMTQVDGEEWMIKFPAHVDMADSCRMEYEYSLCAGKCGIIMSDTRLFSSDLCSGYFGTRRFDRSRVGERVHMLTAAALLELDFRQPSLDYHSLMKLTKILTGNHVEDMENMFLRMCFNVFAHNRDDHSKNFSYLYNESTDQWSLSPAYDLTYSNTYYGEHTTTVDGNGKNPGYKELLTVGVSAGLNKNRCKEMMDFVESCVKDMLGEWL